MYVRIAKKEDAKEIRAINAYYIENTAISFGLEVPSVEDYEKRIEDTLINFPYLVAIIDDKVVGYCYACPFKDHQPALEWVIETSIYIDKDYHKKGIGKALYTELTKYLKQMNIVTMASCITYTDKENKYVNNNSYHFHEALGFKEVAKFPHIGYKFSLWHTIVWMTKDINEHSENTPKVIPFSKLNAI